MAPVRACFHEPGVGSGAAQLQAQERLCPLRCCVYFCMVNTAGEGPAGSAVQNSISPGKLMVIAKLLYCPS